jgi:hypothetical protein
MVVVLLTSESFNEFLGEKFSERRMAPTRCGWFDDHRRNRHLLPGVGSCRR